MEKQAGHTPTPSENNNNQTRTGTERASRGVRHRNVTRKKKNLESQTPYREASQRLAQCLGPRTRMIREASKTCKSVLQYVVENYKKGVDIATLISELENVDLSGK